MVANDVTELSLYFSCQELCSEELNFDDKRDVYQVDPGTTVPNLFNLPGKGFFSRGSFYVMLNTHMKTIHVCICKSNVSSSCCEEPQNRFPYYWRGRKTRSGAQNIFLV